MGGGGLLGILTTISELSIVPSSVFVDILCHLFFIPNTIALYLLSYGSDQTYFEEIKQFYYRDEFSHQVQEWNRQRTMAIERALQQFLYVQMAKELKNKLLAEAKDYVIKVRIFFFSLVVSMD